MQMIARGCSYRFDAILATVSSEQSLNVLRGKQERIVATVQDAITNSRGDTVAADGVI